jgi:drug/metabolite transporter (DMT)-like permease
MISGANAMITLAVQEISSGLASLIFASVPLWVIILRRATGERVGLAISGAVFVGFLGAALLLLRGDPAGGAGFLGLLACVVGAVMSAVGSFALPRIPSPRDPFVSAAWQMFTAGLIIGTTGAAAGELPKVDVETISASSVAAFAYLVVAGSIIAQTAFSWVLERAPISRVSTFAYVNPVVAVLLGWLVVDEVIANTTLVGAALILVSVAIVLRLESTGVRRLEPQAAGG